MNWVRVLLAALGGFATYFVLGGLAFGAIPSLKNEFLKYPAVYRSKEGMMSTVPAGMAMMFVSILALTVIFAMLNRDAAGLALGARFGALVGIFAVGAFVFHNYVNLNVGLSLTIQQSIAYFLEWLATGIVIGLIYRPAGLS